MRYNILKLGISLPRVVARKTRLLYLQYLTYGREGSLNVLFSLPILPTTFCDVAIILPVVFTEDVSTSRRFLPSIFYRDASFINELSVDFSRFQLRKTKYSVTYIKKKEPSCQESTNPHHYFMWTITYSVKLRGYPLPRHISYDLYTVFFISLSIRGDRIRAI